VSNHFAADFSDFERIKITGSWHKADALVTIAPEAKDGVSLVCEVIEIRHDCQRDDADFPRTGTGP
jgi:hypothetical protein